MSYVFIWDSLQSNMPVHLFLKSVGSSLIGYGVTNSNFILLAEQNNCYLLDLPFGTSIVGEIYFLNNKGLLMLDKYYDYPIKYNKKSIYCSYNSCGCKNGKIEKVECIIYCINKKQIIEDYIKNIDKTTKLINDGNWFKYNKDNNMLKV